MPLVLPPTVIGFYLLLLMGPQGPVGRLTEALGVTGTADELAAAFATRSSAQWQQWAADHDIPIVAVR